MLSGAFGSVYLATEKSTGKMVAWKTFASAHDFGTEGLDAITLREVSITKQLKHPNIRQIMDVWYRITFDIH